MAKLPISAENRAHGNRGEAVFKSWLDDSNVPYGYFEQGSWTFPSKLADKMKRPDFLVGIIGLGSFAFDVKCIKISSHGFNINNEEILRLGRFQKYFNTTVFYAFIPQDPLDQRCCLISNDQFLLEAEIHEGPHGTYRTTRAEDIDWVDLTQHSFLDALRHQIELA